MSQQPDFVGEIRWNIVEEFENNIEEMCLSYFLLVTQGSDKMSCKFVLADMRGWSGHTVSVTNGCKEKIKG